MDKENPQNIPAIEDIGLRQKLLRNLPAAGRGA
jgi:hypothetical protein